MERGSSQGEEDEGKEGGAAGEGGQQEKKEGDNLEGGNRTGCCLCVARLEVGGAKLTRMEREQRRLAPHNTAGQRDVAVAPSSKR